MNKKEKELLTYLQENSRYTAKQLAAMTGMDEKEVSDTVSKMEKEGVILKYTAIANAEKIESDTVEAMIEVKATPQAMKGWEAFAEELSSYKEVKSLYLMSGGFDLAVFVTGKNLNDIAKFVAEKLSLVDGVVSVSTHFILKTYKVEGSTTFVPAENERQIAL